MQIETARLQLIQLTEREMQEFGNSEQGGRIAFEAAHSCFSDPGRREHPPAFYRRYEEMAKDSSPEEKKWYLFWEIVLLEGRRRIGGVLFKGAPDAEGEVEIGYGIEEAYRCIGYGAEAVEAVCQWALGQPLIKAVTAKVNPGNEASQKLLQKIGMRHYRNIGKMPCWRLDREE